MKRTGLWWWIDRWRKSTAFTDMTLEQQGAYRNLLDEGALRGGPIPNADRILAKACGDATRWSKVKAVVLARFTLTPDGWRNATLDDVIRQSEESRAARAEAGRTGAAARWQTHGKPDGKRNSKPDGKTMPPDPDPESTHIPRARQAPLIVAGGHRNHAMCGVVCVPAGSWESMLTKLGGDEARLTEWIRGVLTDWQGRVDRGESVPDGNDFDFWRHRWTETFGSTKPAEPRPAETGRSVPDGPQTSEYLANLRGSRAAS